MSEDGDIVPLIRVEGSTYVPEESTLEWLRSLPSHPIVVMMVAGKFRTGKSFLLNRFLKCKPGKAFGVGDTVQACTRGLWLCKKFVRKADGEGHYVLVVDTEGIDALDVESAHDMRIFALAVLLGSVFCFNSFSHIDEASVQTLSLMTRVATSMATVSHKPSLYWILRDFALQMVDENGTPMTHQQYLESALTTPPSSASKCATRQAIKDIFGTRHLVTLPRPHKSEATRLEKMDRKGGGGGDVNAKFERFLSTFRDHVCEHGPCMTAAGVPMTGPVYAEYVKTIVSLVNESDSVPPLNDAWSMLTQMQHSNAVQEVKRKALEVAQAECPTSSEHHVKAFVESTVQKAFENTQFMDPRPDKESVIRPLVEEIVALMRSMHRIQDMEKIVQAKVDELVEKRKGMEAIEAWDMVAFLAAELGFDEEKDMFASKALEAIVKQLWPKVVQRLESDEWKSRCDREHITRVDQEVEELREREASLKAEVDALTCRSREDAATSTDDLVYNLSSPTSELAQKELLVKSEVEKKEALNLAEVEATRADAAQLRCTKAEAEAKRLADQCKSFEEGLETLRTEAEVEIRRSKDESDNCKKEMKHAMSQRDVLVEEVDKLQRLVREGQEKVVEMHRQSLEETRKRDADARAHNDGVRKAHSEMCSRAEVSERENKTLKRRVEELLVSDSEAKRLRGLVQEHEVSKARFEVEVDTLKNTLESMRVERDTLRDNNMELNNRIAVLEAAQKLESCRRSIREA